MALCEVIMSVNDIVYVPVVDKIITEIKWFDANPTNNQSIAGILLRWAMVPKCT